MFDLKHLRRAAFGLVLAAVFAATTATAQEVTPAPDAATPETPPVVGDAPQAEGLSLGETADGVGSSYTRDTFGDWQLRCIRVAEGDEPCQLYQLLRDANGGGVAEISMFALPPGQQAVAGATIVTPLETLLTQQITLKVDTAEAKRYPFTWCSTIGCISRVGFTAPEVEGFRKGAKATLTIVPVAAPDQLVALNMSLNGFTAGFEAVAALNSAPAAP